MYVQLIEGRTTDPDGLLRQLRTWREELRPGAIGFLGSTGGVADDGTVVLCARFASETDAEANSDRPEQDAWWAQTARCFDGSPTFRETTDVTEFLGGGNDAAGFVQVMKGTITDSQALDALMEETIDELADARPDVVGILSLRFGDQFCDIAYFTDEAGARAGESSEMSEAMADAMTRMQTIQKTETYIDLRDPQLTS